MLMLKLAALVTTAIATLQSVLADRVLKIDRQVCRNSGDQQ
jgi:hypothetical protein